MRRDLLDTFARKLSLDDVVVIEATGNASSAAAVVAPHVKKVVIANPKQVRIIAYTATIDIPQRFRNSKAVGPILGLTPKLDESGESKRVGCISLGGDAMMRTLLYEAAQCLLRRVAKWSWLKAWAMNVAKRRGLRKAVIALARRLAFVPAYWRLRCPPRPNHRGIT